MDPACNSTFGVVTGLVSDREWDLLLQAVSRQDVQGDEDYNILVRSLFLYEYRDAQGRWFGLNPLGVNHRFGHSGRTACLLSKVQSIWGRALRHLAQVNYPANGQRWPKR